MWLRILAVCKQNILWYFCLILTLKSFIRSHFQHTFWTCNLINYNKHHHNFLWLYLPLAPGAEQLLSLLWNFPTLAGTGKQFSHSNEKRREWVFSQFCRVSMTTQETKKSIDSVWQAPKLPKYKLNSIYWCFSILFILTKHLLLENFVLSNFMSYLQMTECDFERTVCVSFFRIRQRNLLMYNIQAEGYYCPNFQINMSSDFF